MSIVLAVGGNQTRVVALQKLKLEVSRRIFVRAIGVFVWPRMRTSTAATEVRYGIDCIVDLN